MSIDRVYQMRGKRQVIGLRLRAVDPEACQRLLDNPAATDDELRVRVLLNNRYELLNVPVTWFRPMGDSSETEWHMMGVDPGRINRERLERRPPHLSDYGPPPPGPAPPAPILLRPLYDVMTIETPDGWVAELIDGPDVELRPGELEFEEACWEMEFHPDAFKARAEREQAARDERKKQIEQIGAANQRLALALMQNDLPQIRSGEVTFESGADQQPAFDQPTATGGRA